MRNRSSPTMVLLFLLCAHDAIAQTPVVVTAGASPTVDVANDGPTLALLEAVRTALRIHPDIEAAHAMVDARSADLLSARSILDPVVIARVNHQRSRTPILIDDRLAMETRAQEDATGVSLSGLATLPWGMQLGPTVTLTGVHQYREPEDPVLAGIIRRTSRARTELVAMQPLGRGRGELGTLSGVVAAQREHQAALHASAHVVQQTVFAVIAAYWDLVGATQQVAIAAESEVRARKLLEETRTLVDANQRPAGDLVQLEGHLWTRVRAMFEAQRARRVAAHGLALAMGRSGAEPTPDWWPTDTLPVPTTAAYDLASKATEAREDLRAVGQSVDSARALLAGAERNAMPALDLRLSLGYEGAINDDRIGSLGTALGSNVAGLNVGASLTLELPILNTARRAIRDRQSAELRRRESLRDDLKRQVQIHVSSALDELRLSAEALTAAERAASRYARAIEDERTKLRAGLSTVIDVVLTQDLLTQAELALAGSRLDYALTLARVRFEAGDLPSNESEIGGRLPLVLQARSAAGGIDGGR